jgi:tumor protein p53-inducible protein 3
LPHFETGRLNKIIDQVYNLEDIAQAHTRMESNLNIGKILIKINDEEEELKLNENNHSNKKEL